MKRVDRTSKQELKYRYECLREGLQIKDLDILEMLIETRRQDDMGIEEIIKSEGEKKAANNFLLEIEDGFLSKQDINNIYKFKDKEPDSWDFLTDEQKSILENTENFYKQIKRDYLLNRADLMILRKEVTNFVTVIMKNLLKDKKIDNMDNFNEIVSYIINNYTYQDTMKGLGFSVYLDEEINEIYLERYKIDEKTLQYIL